MLINRRTRRIQQAFANKAEIRFVGGCVRDNLLGIPHKDIDFHTPARPEVITDILTAAGIRTVDTGSVHGTVTAIIDGEGFEITTLRQDVDTDGRHATVQFTDNWEVDAARRDLTINAISMDFDGRLYDFHDGVEDLRNGRVRFVGDAGMRIEEDYLRILRYFRFLGRYGMSAPDQQTIDAITAGADGLRQISVERIWSEISKILVGPNGKREVKRMADCQIWDIIGWPIMVGRIATMPISSMEAALAHLLVDIGCLPKAKIKIEEWRKISWFRQHENATAKDLSWLLYEGVNRQFIDEMASLKGLVVTDIPACPVTGGDLFDQGFRGKPLGDQLAHLRRQWFDENFG